MTLSARYMTLGPRLTKTNCSKFVGFYLVIPSSKKSMRSTKAPKSGRRQRRCRSKWLHHPLQQQILPIDRYHQNPKPVAVDAIAAQCKHCGNCTALCPQSGRYGFYVQCGRCGGNTPLKRPCPVCSSQNTKVSKSKLNYRLVCQDCSTAALVFKG